MLIKSSTCLKTTCAPSPVLMSDHSRLVSTVSSFKDSSVKGSDLSSTLRMSSWGPDATKMISCRRILTHCRANIDALPQFAHGSFLECGFDLAIQLNIGGVAKCILVDRTYPKPMRRYPLLSTLPAGETSVRAFLGRRYKRSQKQRELICAFPERRNAFLQFCRGAGGGAAANEDANPKPQHAGS
jgi:hypothetical protein